MITEYKENHPVISDSAFLIGDSFIAGKIVINEFASIWPGVVARGDLNLISIGEGTNIQDNSVLHVDDDKPLIIGKNVTVGHNAVLHGCTIADHVLIGIGAIVLSGATIGEYTLVGAGSLVPEGKVLKSGKLYFGSPVKEIRDLTEKEKEAIGNSARHYIETAKEYTRYPK